MKRLVLKSSFLLVAIASLYCFQKKENRTLKNLALANIEALAAGEGGGTTCIGSGSIDCYGYKVDYKATDFSFGHE